MAIFTLANLAVGALASTFSIGALGTCLLATSMEDFDMGEYNDRH